MRLMNRLEKFNDSRLSVRLVSLGIIGVPLRPPLKSLKGGVIMQREAILLENRCNIFLSWKNAFWRRKKVFMLEVCNEESNCHHPGALLAFHPQVVFYLWINSLTANVTVKFMDKFKNLLQGFDKEVSGNYEAFLGCPIYPKISCSFQKCSLRKELSNDFLSSSSKKKKI